MRRLSRSLILGVMLGVSWLPNPLAHAEPNQFLPAAMDCEWNAFQLQCQFRPLAPVAIQSLELAIDDGKPQPIGHWQPFIGNHAVSAILWFLDVSNPARGNTLARQIDLLRGWSAGLSTYHRLGLASFADGAKLLVTVRDDKSTAVTALEGLAARGQSTAFYRSLLEGVEFLKQVQAQRKSLWVFSDGLAEDTAYTHDDVVGAAKAAGVMIVGLGYPERESQQTGLQRLQRLAEETGGYFAAAPVRGTLPLGTLAAILAVVDGGGDFTVDLPELRGPHRLTLRLLAAGNAVFTKTVEIKAPAPPERSPAGLTDQPRPGAGQLYRTWILLSLGVLALLLWLVWERRRPLPKPPPLARLELMNSSEVRELAIHTPIARIGRAQGNELRLENDSVSAHHAELRRGRDGRFSIVDLGSTNGVWVNGEQVGLHGLRDGDVLELGEVRMRFRQVLP